MWANPASSLASREKRPQHAFQMSSESSPREIYHIKLSRNTPNSKKQINPLINIKQNGLQSQRIQSPQLRHLRHPHRLGIRNLYSTPPPSLQTPHFIHAPPIQQQRSRKSGLSLDRIHDSGKGNPDRTPHSCIPQSPRRNLPTPSNTTFRPVHRRRSHHLWLYNWKMARLPRHCCCYAGAWQALQTRCSIQHRPFFI